MAPRSIAEKSFSAPTCCVIGVRAPPRMKTSFDMILVAFSLQPSAFSFQLSAFSFQYSFRNPIAACASAQSAANVGRGLPFADRGFDGRLYCFRFVARAEGFEHQRSRKDRADRVGDVLSGEGRRRAVHRLEQGGLPRMDVARGRHPEAALQRATDVGDD